ncbi:arylamine N-acetyltransferase family protein [Roseobacter sp. EG26]|uniref:arylamine N-acetyltransferase family protein n=1 Tax=Roseobacter sp. EG26 TaxID=3412477 RepID=UPI003CE4A8C5
MTSIDLEAYFDRIGYSGHKHPTLDTLAKIQLLHTQTIPFENLDPFLRLPVQLEIRAIERKLVQGRRGGYCFEHNILLKHILEVLGFKVKGLAARVLWHAPPDLPTPSTHMLLRVEFGGQSYIVDAGFGGQVLTAPLMLVPDIVQETPHEPFRLEMVEGRYVLQSQISGAWQPIYGFDLSERLGPDFEILNYFLSTSPKSPFVTGLMIARPAPGRRWTLSSNVFRDRQFTNGDRKRGAVTLAEHRLTGEIIKREINTQAELVEALRHTFLIEPPQQIELLAYMQHAPTRSTGTHD